MWECKKCHERHEDSFEVCWNCGTSKAGVEDPTFRAADEVDPAFLEQSASQQVNETGITATLPDSAAISRPEENGYEFTPEQNEVIGSLARSMQIVGIVSVIAGSLLVVGSIVLIAKGGASALIQGVVALVIGSLTMQAGNAFSRIVDSRGSDISHLMTALSKLRSLYQLQVILFCIALGLLVLAFCMLRHI